MRVEKQWFQCKLIFLRLIRAMLIKFDQIPQQYMFLHLLSKSIRSFLKALIMPITTIIRFQVYKLPLYRTRNRIKMRKSILHIFLTIITNHFLIHGPNVIKYAFYCNLTVTYIMEDCTR